MQKSNLLMFHNHLKHLLKNLKNMIESTDSKSKNGKDLQSGGQWYIQEKLFGSGESRIMFRYT